MFSRKKNGRAVAAGSGPAWLGIGVQRCGTSSFTGLLCQHPAVTLTPEGKELHLLHNSLVDAWDDADDDGYRSLFPPDELAGEFTPSYLRALWVPDVARRVVREGAPIIVLVRDPVDRYRSLMHMAQRVVGHDDKRRRARWARNIGMEAQWSGMYATQLDAWARVFPREQFEVIEFGAFIEDQQSAVERVWRRLGLTPKPLKIKRTPKPPIPGAWDFDEVPGLREQLVALYAPEVKRLADEWGVDTSGWRNVAG